MTQATTTITLTNEEFYSLFATRPSFLAKNYNHLFSDEDLANLVAKWVYIDPNGLVECLMYFPRKDAKKAIKTALNGKKILYHRKADGSLAPFTSTVYAAAGKFGVKVQICEKTGTYKV